MINLRWAGESDGLIFPGFSIYLGLSSSRFGSSCLGLFSFPFTVGLTLALFLLLLSVVGERIWFVGDVGEVMMVGGGMISSGFPI